MELDQQTRVPQNLPGSTGSPHQNLLSHLPLHSQQQTQSLIPVVPIGGVRVPACSLLSSSTDRGLSPAPSPQMGDSPWVRTREEPAGAPDSGGGDDSAQNSLSPPGDSQGNVNTNSIKQEENVQTCLRAIASLSIASEEPK